MWSNVSWKLLRSLTTCKASYVDIALMIIMSTLSEWPIENAIYWTFQNVIYWKLNAGKSKSTLKMNDNNRCGLLLFNPDNNIVDDSLSTQMFSLNCINIPVYTYIHLLSKLYDVTTLWTSARLHTLKSTCITFREDRPYFKGMTHKLWNNDGISSTKYRAVTHSIFGNTNMNIWRPYQSICILVLASQVTQLLNREAS